MCRYIGENNSNKESSYTKDGFTNFRKDTEIFKVHQEFHFHRTATLLDLNRLSQVDSCAAQLNSEHKKQINKNRRCLALIFKILMWLTKQGLALPGIMKQKIKIIKATSCLFN